MKNSCDLFLFLIIFHSCSQEKGKKPTNFPNFYSTEGEKITNENNSFLAKGFFKQNQAKTVYIMEHSSEAKKLEGKGYDALRLKVMGFTAFALKNLGFTAGDLMLAGYNVRQLKEAGFNAADLKQAGFSIFALKSAGFTATEAEKAGFSQKELSSVFKKTAV